MSGHTFLQRSSTESKLDKPDVHAPMASLKLRIDLDNGRSLEESGRLSSRQFEQLLLLLRTGTTEEATSLRKALKRAQEALKDITQGRGSQQDKLRASVALNDIEEDLNGQH